MPRRERITAAEIEGTWAIIPTPAKDNASDWRAADTVDLEETARVVDQLVRAGVNGILSLGTFGEGATLTWSEKRAFMAAAVDSIAGRVPFFGGTTSLNTRDTIEQTRAAADIGVDGTMLGVPMWCKSDVPTAVQFYRDVAQACPDTAICVYPNQEAFKFEFPRPFWAQVAEIEQVVAAKYVGLDRYLADLRITKGRIRLLPTENHYYAASRMAPEECTGFWSGGSVCGPELALKLRDQVVAAKRSHDWQGAKETAEAIAAAYGPLFPRGDFAEFSKYNVGLEKARMDAAGWMKAGPCRPPYHLVPPDYLKGAQESGRLWAQHAARLRG